MTIFDRHRLPRMVGFRNCEECMLKFEVSLPKLTHVLVLTPLEIYWFAKSFFKKFPEGVLYSFERTVNKKQFDVSTTRIVGYLIRGK